MTRSMIVSETFCVNSKELLSVTILTVLLLESYSTWHARHYDRCSSSS